MTRDIKQLNEPAREMLYTLLIYSARFNQDNRRSCKLHPNHDRYAGAQLSILEFLNLLNRTSSQQHSSARCSRRDDERDSTISAIHNSTTASKKKKPPVYEVE